MPDRSTRVKLAPARVTSWKRASLRDTSSKVEPDRSWLLKSVTVTRLPQPTDRGAGTSPASERAGGRRHLQTQAEQDGPADGVDGRSNGRPVDEVARPPDA